MLTIYSASAGTGKTHTLTGRYLSLLFNGKDAHRRILAITFTNKATAEMKNRIITELFKLADGQPSDFADVIAHSRSVPVIANEAKQSPPLSQTTLQTTARKLLIDILHDYSTFNISTIDHFFQRTVRAFTREIGLQGNYQIELDENVMLNEAVDNMMSELEKDDNGELVDWLIQFAESKIDAGKSRDVRQDIVKLGQELFKEAFKTQREIFGNCLNEKNVLKNYRTDIYKLIRSKESAARSLGERGLALMLKHGLQPTDMTGKRNSPFNLFAKLARGEVAELTKGFLKLPDNVDAYCAKNDKPHIKTAAIELYNDGMNNLVGEVVNFLTNTTDYCTAKAIAANFHALGILADLSAQLYKWREDNNSLFISDTTELLNKIIDGSEIPFIYEKTGTKIEHYMIDEFQDTSAMQWDNLRPLVKDSLDAGRANLIVGDVKQSIYRFRNSDWSLLDKQVIIDFPELTKEKKLNINWRSFKNIVEFNNLIFEAVPYLLQNEFNQELNSSPFPEENKTALRSMIVSAYKDSHQFVAPPFENKVGHVRIEFLTDEQEDKWESKSMKRLPVIIENLQDNGYKLHDIAILTRTGKEGIKVAETLLEYRENHPDSKYRYDIITEESLMVGSALSVRWIVAMLKYINDIYDNDSYFTAQFAYAVMLRKKLNLNTKLAINEMVKPFSENKINELTQLSNRSLGELIETVIRLFSDDIPNNELVFIQAFTDIAADYSTNEKADIGSFLDWWNTTGCTKAIKTPDSQNAIRIITIHKSKGLGFKAVIIPFTSWTLDGKDNIIWCKPDRQPFNNLSLVPVKYSKAMAKSFFANNYFNEKLYSEIDNLNVMYVAFTRAKEELIIMAPQPKKSEFSTVNVLLYEAIKTDEKFLYNSETGVYERGEWHIRKDPPSKSVANEMIVNSLHSVSPDERMQLRLRPKGGYLYDENRRYGLLMHDILSNIVTVSDIHSAIVQKVTSGEISATEAPILQNRLTELILSEPVAQWFDGSQQVLQETEILFAGGQSRRPDRILIDADGKTTIIDYKFGDRKEISHIHQIRKYLSLINEMGYLKTSGYLWYVTLGEIEHVVN